jgi:Asp/Glu/hydantoin racemase
VVRITLVHALKHSIAPIEAAFARLWPQPLLMNLLDDSLSADLARNHGLTPAMTDRFLRLGDYAVATGCDGILFTCSAFGPCIDAVKARHPGLPVLKPNEAMIADAEAAGRTIGLIATFAATLRSMPQEFPTSVTVRTVLAEGALAALDRGDAARHDTIAAEAAVRLADCDVIALAQFSLARAAPLVAARTGKPVLTTPDSAVTLLHRRIAGAG